MVLPAIGRWFRHPPIANKIFLFLCVLGPTVLLILLYSSFSHTLISHSGISRIYSFDWTEDNQHKVHGCSSIPGHKSLCIPLSTKVDKWTMYTVSRQQLAPLNSEQPLSPYCANVYNDVAFSYSINPTDRLLKVVKDKENAIGVFVTVISAPGNFEKRRRIRETWARSMNSGSFVMNNIFINYSFFVGSTTNSEFQNKITEESLINGDIIQVDLSDAYVNLTQKTVALLHWAHTFCSNDSIDFILKTDDDVFVNVYNFVETVVTLSPETKAVYGYGMENRKPVRVAGKKWTMSNDTWPWDKYPPYLLGGCYMISRTAVRPLLAAASTTPFFVFEDIFLNGLCAPKAEVQVQSSKRFVAVRGSKLPDACFVRDTITWVARDLNVSHTVTEDYFRFKTTKCSPNKNSMKEHLRFKVLSL